MPSGTVTFLFTDVEGSTRLWEQHPQTMRAALARHDALIEAAVERHGGAVVRPRGEGDSRFAVFARATDALSAATALQQALGAERWPLPEPVRVRVALHTGEADLRDGDYYGSAVNRCARLRAIAHGGQSVLSRATYDLVCDALMPGVSLHDLGEHRLADLQRPEQVYQLVASGLPSEFPPLRSLESVPHNLPLQLTSFVGREREMSEVTRLLGQTRLLTLTGVGGTGKTRLALQVAAGLVHDYRDGVWLIELAPLADPARVPGAVAGVLGIVEDATRPLLATLIGVLRTKRALLVLDNCEHMIEACAELANALLHGCPQVQILATSREALGIAGEVAWSVPSLALPEAVHLPSVETLAQCEAVRLFVERAQVVQPRFKVTEQNATVVAQVCRRLDGIPLALELAAARLRALSVEQVAARLDQRFRLLTGGSRTALPRQQTLHATVDWSYELLSPTEQRLLARLSVFAGGFTLAAAEAICVGGEIAATEVLDLLARLVEKSLVEAGMGEEARYRLLETLRQYGRERLLASTEAVEMHDRHAAYYLALAEQAESEFRGLDQRRWFDHLELEHDNLRTALAWCLDQAATAHASDTAMAAPAGLRLAGSLWVFWWQHGHWREGLSWLEQTLACNAAAPGIARAKALCGAGNLAWQLGDASRANAWQTEGVALYRQSDDTSGLVEALGYYGLSFLDLGQDEQAVAMYEEALQRAREGGVAWDIGAALMHQATGVYFSAAMERPDERARARVACEESLRRLRESGDVTKIGWVEHVLGQLAHYDGDCEKAKVMLEASVSHTRAAGHRIMTGHAMLCLGEVACELGDYTRAAVLYNDCLRGFAGLNVGPNWRIEVLLRLGNLALHQGQWVEAQTHALECVREVQSWSRPVDFELYRALEVLAGVAAAQGAARRALRLAGCAAALRERIGASLWPFDHTALLRWLSPARQALSTDVQTKAWAEGQAMIPEEAIAYALEAEPITDGDAQEQGEAGALP